MPLPDASFDLALSEYGASIWCDPYKWIPEAARLLRPGGELLFLRNSTISMLCAALDGPAARPCRGRSAGCTALDWEDDDTTEFQLGHGDLFKLLRDIGLRRPRPRRALRAGRRQDADYYDFGSPTGRRSGRAEEIWKARKR